MSNELTRWENAKQAIAECKTIDEVKEIRDRAEAMRAYAKQAKESLTAQNDLCEIKLRAERRAGEMLREADKQKPGEYQRLHDVTVAPSLKDYGIQKHESSRWQKIASIPQDSFDEIIVETKQKQKELTESMMLKLEKEINKKTETPELPENKYAILYADPPWKYTSGDQHTDTSQETVLGTHYNSLTISELCELPIAELTQENAVLFLWVTSPLLEESFSIIKAWGFKYKTSMVWDKVKHNVGNYVSVRHELLLICTKGSYTPQIKKLFDSVYSEERTIHSKKPEYFRTVIDTIYPQGKRIELFCRGSAPTGWDAWGNEV